MGEELWIRIDKQESFHGRRVEITWEPFVKDADEPVVREYWQKLTRNALDFALKKFNLEMGTAEQKVVENTNVINADLIEAGHVLFQNLVDRDFSHFHLESKNVHQIYISTRMVYVPWELVTPPQGKPWGVKYSIGNQVRAPKDVRNPLAPTKSVIHVLLVAADSDPKLEHTYEEIQEICNLLKNNDRIGHIDILTSNSDSERLTGDMRLRYAKLTHDYFLECIRNPEYDIIHFAGHIQQPEAGMEDHGSYLDFGDDQKVHSSTIYGNLGGTPFVFLNGCGIMWKDAPITLTQIADGFIFGGARGVLVPRTVIADEAARSMAIRYYELLINGETFGEALRQIREREYQIDPTSLNWITYILFGKPSMRLFVMERDLFLPDSETKEMSLNRKAFDEEALGLIIQAAQWARYLRSQQIEPKHFFLALTYKPLLCATYMELENVEPWPVMKELRKSILRDIPIPSSFIGSEEINLKKTLFSEKSLSILSNAHKECSGEGIQTKVNLLEIASFLVKTNDDSIKEAVIVTQKSFDLLFLRSIEDISNHFSEKRYGKVISEEYIDQVLVKENGLINKQFLSEGMQSLFSICSLLANNVSEIFGPIQLLSVLMQIPYLNTAQYIKEHPCRDFPLDPVLTDALAVSTSDFGVNIHIFNEMCQLILYAAAIDAREMKLKLSEKHIVRKIAASAKEAGVDEKLIIFLGKLNSETVLW